MQTIVDVVEGQLESDRPGAGFIFLERGENAGPRKNISQIRNSALRIATELRRGERALILLPQGLLFIDALFACLYAGAIAIPAAIPSRKRGTANISNILRDAGVTVCLIDTATLAGFEKDRIEVLNDVRICIVDDDSNLSDSFASSLVRLPKADDIALLQYTSGSTGQPKGVIITHENIVANSRTIAECFGNTTESVSVCWVPSFHDMGLIDGIFQPVFTGFCSVMMSPLHFSQRPVRWLKALSEYKATYSGGPNFAFDLCVDRIDDEEVAGLDLSNLRCLYNGSEIVRQRTIKRFVDKFGAAGVKLEKIVPCYGLAEATLAVTVAPFGREPRVLAKDAEHETELEKQRNIVGCGLTFGDTTLRITSPVTFEELPENAVGEVWVSGRSIAAGYYGNSETTAETFVEHEGKRYLRTGDLGFVLGGELFIAGRMKDVVIAGGRNHYSHDLEYAIVQSHHALQPNGCAAFSVHVQEQEKLIVVGEVRRSFAQQGKSEEIVSKIKAELNAVAGVAPHDVVLIPVNKLPKTTSGKIERNKCRTLWESSAFESIAFTK